MTQTLGVIPARGGSKGVKKKNIRSIDGKPLIAYSIRASRDAESVDDTLVSTDDQEIADVAEEYGADVPFLRPESLATDESPTEPVIEHALTEMDKEYDDYVLLQPTSPLRTSEDIDEAYGRFADSEADSLISCYPSYSERWKMTEQGAEQINYTDAPVRRQEREPEYITNGAIYLTDASLFLETGEITAGTTAVYEMSERQSVDIDTKFDLWLAEKIIQEWEDD
jgi:N-acylneuraminate cytidylyltransferase/CMP-N,N'-diacetyllegionaminic acid synthase